MSMYMNFDVLEDKKNIKGLIELHLFFIKTIQQNANTCAHMALAAATSINVEFVTALVLFFYKFQ